MSLLSVREYVDPRSKFPSFSSETTMLADEIFVSRRREAARLDREVEMRTEGSSAGGVRDWGIEG